MPLTTWMWCVCACCRLVSPSAAAALVSYHVFKEFRARGLVKFYPIVPSRYLHLAAMSDSESDLSEESSSEEDDASCYSSDAMGGSKAAAETAAASPGPPPIVVVDSG